MAYKNPMGAGRWGGAMVLAILLCVAPLQAAEVQFARLPRAGIQPQAMVDAQGAIHLLFFRGKPGGGDLFYTRMTAGETNWGAELRVNRQSGSAIATGTIRGGQMALGRSGRLHVVWNGSQRATNHSGVPFYYTRLQADGRAFEMERDLVQYAVGLDGGGSVAADGYGNVWAIWHGSRQEDADDESARKVFLARSTDDGATFARETPVSPSNEGVCACCGLRGLVGDDGLFLIFYRAVFQQTNRNSTLILSRNAGSSFTKAHTHQWTVSKCPMSSSWLAATPEGIFCAWETAEQVHGARLDQTKGELQQIYSPGGRTTKKHPVFIANHQGDRLLVWVENTGWERGGALAWQVLDRTGPPTAPVARRDGIPVWSFASAVARPDGRFLIIY